jgi:ABC-2 type transport system permease protein
MRTPAAVGMLGVVFSPTLGGLVAWRSGLNSAILIAPVSMLFVIRHTRTEEEAGRRELLGASIVGRHAPLTAILSVMFVATLIIAAIMSVGLISMDLPVAGAVALGLSAASAGWMFAAGAAVTAQLTESPGPARGIVLAAFGVAYLLRAAGDVSGSSWLSWLSWLSPLGWIRFTRAFADEQWWVFALIASLTAALSTLAYVLAAQRDLGAGLFPAPFGPATTPGLRSPLALAWRLQRGALLGWAAGAAMFGTLLGIVGQSIGGFVDIPQVQNWMSQIGAHDVSDTFLFVFMYVLGQVASAYALTAVLWMRSEEVDGRVDAVLATPTSRLRWASSHLLFALGGPLVILTMLGVTIGLGYGLSVGNVGNELPRLLSRALRTLPAVWVVAGIAMACYGLAPRFAVVGAWAVLSAFLALELGWELQQISPALFALSPFAHVFWAAPVRPATLAGLATLAVILTTVGLLAFQRRDVG